jgi:chromosomal replication initiator protein
LAATRGIVLSADAADRLGRGLAGTVPELCGALLRLEMSAREDSGTIDADRINLFLRMSEQGGQPTLRQIATTTARYCETSLADLKSPSRKQALVRGRRLAIYLARSLTKCSLEEIGRFFGGRDHTTVLHSFRQAEREIAADPVCRRAVAELVDEIRAN